MCQLHEEFKTLLMALQSQKKSIHHIDFITYKKSIVWHLSLEPVKQVTSESALGFVPTARARIYDHMPFLSPNAR